MRSLWLLSCLFLLPAPAAVVVAEEAKWIELIGEKASGDVWKSKLGGWARASEVKLDPKNAKKLVFEPGGKTILVNGKNGRERDLVTKESYGDIELELEFLIAKGSNSGVKFHALYEIQIYDSYGSKKELTGNDCGGIYPRAELLPIYRYLDKGVPPKTNACKRPGEWQKLTAIFLAPRFDANTGKKTENAKLVKATLNGKVIHENVELKTPTGHNWKKKEVAKGPLLLQGDHGPVAFRNVRLRHYDRKK
jgi:hypothetical protein